MGRSPAVNRGGPLVYPGSGRHVRDLVLADEADLGDHERVSETGDGLHGRLLAAGLDVRDISGILYEPWKHAARLTSRTDVNYLMQAGKPE